MIKSKNLLALIGTLMLLLSLSVPMMQCAPAVEEKGAYEDYVASLSELEYPVPRDCFEQAMEEGSLNVYCWAGWWPEEMFTNFEEEFGIKITQDHISSGAEAIAKIKLNPEVELDLLIAGTTTAFPLKNLGLLKEVNYDWLPNHNAYGTEEMRTIWGSLDLDEVAPFQDIPFTAFAYNAKYVDDPAPTWKTLFEPEEKYRGRISMLDQMHECISAALIYLGYSINTSDEGELMEAKEVLLRQKPYVMAYDAWPKRLLLEEEAWIAHLWCGDTWVMHQELEDLRTLLPVEGSQLAPSCTPMPIGGTNPAMAHLFLNYIFRPEASAILYEGIGYTPAHTLTADYLSEGLRDWPGTVPPEGYVAKCEFHAPEIFEGRTLEIRSAIWEELKAA